MQKDAPMLTRLEVAKELGVSVWTIDRWKTLGTIPRPAIDKPRTPRWTREQIEQVKTNQVASDSIG